MPVEGCPGKRRSDLQLLKGHKRGGNEQISYENYTLAFPLRKTLSVRPGRGPDSDKWLLMEQSKSICQSSLRITHFIPSQPRELRVTG